MFPLSGYLYKLEKIKNTLHTEWMNEWSPILMERADSPETSVRIYPIKRHHLIPFTTHVPVVKLLYTKNSLAASKSRPKLPLLNAFSTQSGCSRWRKGEQGRQKCKHKVLLLYILWTSQKSRNNLTGNVSQVHVYWPDIENGLAPWEAGLSHGIAYWQYYEV